MRTIVTILLSAFLILVIGCSTGPDIKNSPINKNHQIDLVIQSKTDSIVSTPLPYERDDSPYLHPSQLTAINRDETIAFTKLFAGLSVSDLTRLWNDIMYIHFETDIKVVHILINSPGGDAFTGLALSDLINRAQDKYGIKFKAYASGIIASAAVPVFAVCDERIAAPGTIFMVHEAALWKWPGRETASDIRSQNDLMILLQDRYLGYLVRNSKLDLESWRTMEKNTTWFSSEKALEYGLTDKVE